MPVRADQERATGSIEEVWKSVSESAGRIIDAAFSADLFWSQPDLDPNEPTVLDGEQFLVEAVSGDRYHLVKRSGRLKPALRSAIESLVRLAGWSLEWKGC